jgi:lysophospholipase L1-like esterase
MCYPPPVRRNLSRFAARLGAALLAALGPDPAAARTGLLAIGDSLTAEYRYVPDYGTVTVPGWQSMSWFEILGALRPAVFDLGGYRPLDSPWDTVRLYGYENNWAVPGAEAEDWRNYWSDPLNPFFPFVVRFPGSPVTQPTLEEIIADEAEVIVLFLGANDIREDYTRIAEGGDPEDLLDEIEADIGWIIGRIRSVNPTIPVVLANVPDLGAAPAKKEDHPDPVERARVSAAVAALGGRLAALASARGIGFADIRSQTAALIAGEPYYFGAVRFEDAADPDNDPGFLFCRDGFHPNLAAQIGIANAILAGLNARYGTPFQPISAAEALAFLGIDPDQPYADWAESFGLAGSPMGADPDGDRRTNLEEYAMGSSPAAPGGTPAAEIAWPGGAAEFRWRPDPARERHVRAVPETSDDLAGWEPAEEGEPLPDGTRVFRPVPGESRRFFRLRFEILPP